MSNFSGSDKPQSAELEQALLAYNEALKTGQPLQINTRTHRPYTRADIYSAFGEYHKAIQEWENELAMAQKSGNQKEVCYLLTVLGAYYVKTGSDKGITYIQSALKVAQNISDPEEEAQALIELATFYGRQQQWQGSLEQLNKVKLIAQAIDNKRYLHLALGNMGAIYVAQGKYQESIALLTQAGGIAQALGDKLEEADYVRNLGMAQFHLREGGKALMYFDYYQHLCTELHIPPDAQILILAQQIRDIFAKRSNL